MSIHEPLYFGIHCINSNMLCIISFVCYCCFELRKPEASIELCNIILQPAYNGEVERRANTRLYKSAFIDSENEEGYHI